MGFTVLASQLRFAPQAVLSLSDKAEALAKFLMQPES